MAFVSNIDLYPMRPLSELTIDEIDDQGIANLREAIVLDACKDYTAEVHFLKQNITPDARKYALKRMEKLAAFFRSGWFDLLSGGIDGEKVMHTLRYDTPRKWLSTEERKELEKRERDERKKAEAEAAAQAAVPDKVSGRQRSKDHGVAGDTDAPKPSRRKRTAAVRPADA
jgi:hypothetical protein